MISKIIYSIWLNTEKKLPSLVSKCLDSVKKLDGYEHIVITLDNCYHNKYIDECLSRNDVKGWVKAADYLRAYYVHKTGGIYLDADTEVRKSFDPLLINEMFLAHEDNLFLANGIFGAEKGHQSLKEFLEILDTFDGTNDLVFENGMEQWTPIMYKARENGKATIYPPEYFIPYNHQTGKTNITENTYTYHHYEKTWV